jgi:hypothetical protein
MSVYNKWPHYGDLLAIPFFAMTVYYFAHIEEKTALEWLLLFFAISGLIADVGFSALFLLTRG